MAIPGNANLLLLQSAAAAGGYAIERSVRLNSADSAYFSRTPASSGNRKTWTWAGWIKRSALGVKQQIFGVTGTSNANYCENYFGSDDKLYLRYGYTTVGEVVTTQLFRDASAWYHIVFAFDVTQATASNRLRLYVNGAEVTSFSTDTRSTLTNTDWAVNRTAAHYISGAPNGGGTSEGVSGCLADIYFCDGYAYDPSYFTEFDDNGILQPIAFTGSYGTNGFHLPFDDNSTAAALGTDTSGNGNTWTVNNISVTAGAGNDSLVDVPTNGTETDTGVGGEVRGNYCTANPLDSNSSLTIQNGNLYLSNAAASTRASRGTIGISSGKWYWEVLLESALTGSTAITYGIGTSASSLSNYVGSDATGYGWYNDGGGGCSKTNNGSFTNYGSIVANGVIVGVAFDADAGTLTFYRNGVSQGSAFTGITARTYFPMVSVYNVNATLNFGQRPFAYTAPSGFKAINTSSLPAPLVTKPSTVMDVLTWTGNGSNPRSLTGLNFNPDLVWSKDRSGTAFHRVADSVRGTGNKQLYTNSTDAENAYPDRGYISSFDSNGFTVNPTGSTAGGFDAYNTNSTTYVAWCWDAGSSTVTNTSGSISSQVRANATAGFSVVTWTSNGASSIETVGHSLGVTPALIIAKGRGPGTTSNWHVWSNTFSNQVRDYLYLNTTAAKTTAGVDIWSTSSSTFGIRQSSIAVNNDGCVAYCFAPVAGYSSFGSYTGNGSTDGPFVYTGFRPRWVMIKNTGDGYDGGSLAFSHSWVIVDAARYGYNVVMPFLGANKADAEYTANIRLDLLSNGFKIRTNTGTDINGGQTLIYAAFAEQPFQYARAR